VSGWVRVGVAGAAVLGLALALVIGRGGGGTPHQEQPRAPATTATARPVPAALEEFMLMPIRVRGAKPVGGVQRLTVARGAHVSIGVDSDAYDRVVLHGYELQAAVEPFRETVLTFTAGTPGRFDVELANGSILIGRITVTR
jgi:hypothetical protein